MATYKKQLKDQNGNNIIPALGTATVTSTNIDWSSCSGTETGPDGNVWNWTYLLDGRKMFYTHYVFNIPSGGTGATSWRNSSNSLKMPAGLTRTTALVVASMAYYGNGEVTSSPIWRNSSNSLSCGSYNYYNSNAYNVDGNVIVIPLS